MSCNSVEANKKSNFSETFAFIEVNCITETINSTYTDDFDSIQINIYKSATECIDKPTSFMLSFSQLSRSFPNCFKFSEAVTVFKKGDSNDVQNYRPISIFSALFKIFETATSKGLNEFNSHSNNKNYVGNLNTVFLKIFYLIDYEILFYKLNHYYVRIT